MAKYFLDAFPDMKTILRKKADVTLYDFVDVDKMVLINRRGAFSYDVLLQPDILRILRILDPGCTLGPRVDLGKKEAERYAEDMKDAIRERKELLVGAETRNEIKGIAARIFWGTYSLLVENRRAGLNSWEPYYLAVRKTIT